MEEGVNKVQGLLGQLKEHIGELIPSFEEIVEQQAEKLASKQRKELRKKLKTEQDDANNECKKIRLETEEIITDIGRVTRKEAQDIRSKHGANLKAIAHKEKLIKNSEELENIAPETTNHDTMVEVSYFSEIQPMEVSENLVSHSSVSPKCATCGKESVWLYFCSACKVTRYCDESCQTKDWKKHKQTCSRLSYN